MAEHGTPSAQAATPESFSWWYISDLVQWFAFKHPHNAFKMFQASHLKQESRGIAMVDYLHGGQRPVHTISEFPQGTRCS